VADDTSSRGISARIAETFGTIFTFGGFGFAAVLGIMAQVGVIGAYRRGDADLPTAIAIFAFSLILSVIGVGYFYFRYAVMPMRDARTTRRAALHPDAPWMLDEAWAQRKVTDRASLAVAIFLWVWSVGWNGICAFIWTVNWDKIISAVHESWTDAAFAVVFPLCGLIGVLCAIGATLHWWRYGASTLHIDTLPGYLGDEFRGRIVTRMPSLVPLEVELVCERRYWYWTQSSGRRTREWDTETIWSRAYPIDADRMMRLKDGTTTIPIDVPLPDDKPPCALDEEGAGIQWALAVHTDHERMPKPAQPGAPRAVNYSARFLIPVYARS
jgi:hypothetical protein